jgi:hypothetical protein
MSGRSPEFRTDIADFISRAVVEASIEPGVYERPPSRSRRYVAFIDASGGSGSDSMTLAIAHSEDGIPTLDAVRERRPPFSPDAGVTTRFVQNRTLRGLSDGRCLWSRF